MLLKVYSEFIFSVVMLGIHMFNRNKLSAHDENNFFSSSTHSRHIDYAKTVEKFFNILVSVTGKQKFAYTKEVRFESCKLLIRPFIFFDILMVSGLWEPYVKNILNVREGDVFVDVGAYIGTYSIPIAKRVGRQGKVIAFEPHPVSAEMLEKSIAINWLENIVLIKKAVGDSKKKVLFGFSDNPALSSIESQYETKVEVDCINLDSAMAELGLNNMDWLKIDVEVGEYEVLKGATYCLRKYSPKIIIEMGQKTSQRVKDFLVSEGYSLKHLYDIYYFAFKN